MEAEVIVIDNNSSDGSLQYLEPRFPGIKFTGNADNLGFAKACNQGLKKSSGDYVLFLNPDTLIPEDCFKKCLAFFASHPDAGALGVKMVDGSGKFLKESKRAFPSPLTSLYKLFGFSILFPRSPVFSKYHLGHLNENENNEVDVLAGAFMMIKRKVLDEVGSFDETFFMYGEDVDLSYRIQKAGYKNYYFAESEIMHFKGESTRRGTMNYVRMFYNAMSIFVKKHYGGSRAGVFNFSIHLAIWFRAGLSAIANFIRYIGLPLIDAGLILLAFWLMKNIWSEYVRRDTLYENRLLWFAFPAYTIFFLIAAYYAGLYDRWYKRSELARSVIIATVLLLAGYSLLPEQYRFSRGIILFGAILAFIFISILRWILVAANVLTSNKNKEEQTNTLVVASPAEYEQTVQLLKEAGLEERVLGRVAVTEGDESATGHWKKIKPLSLTIPFREVIFCQGTLSFADIIESIKTLPSHIVAKVHSAGSSSIVGSSQKDSSGEAVSKENGYKLGDPYNRRLKRLIDVVVSVLGLITFPVHLVFVKDPFQFFANCMTVLFAQKTWVGYAVVETHLPALRSPVIACNGMPVSAGQKLPIESLRMMDQWYARDYEPAIDLKLIRATYRKLGS